ncbi:MAG: bifunctional 5,10-methylenetetrahydrofolate dehydrogenase/5,10-methenyltetrahydrofolate cyclohydrolase [Caldisericia bacterium]|nr:bifunctional 5,10-methylenetetrahydrofolate dehydrogenase/5,10-methenyltetrahydrofolate cyclohydrolase [Caldisericia bacterium]
MSQAECMEGRSLSRYLKEEMKNKIAETNSSPTLSSIVIGSSRDALSYVRSQKKVAEKIGINYNLIQLEKNISQKHIIECIKALNLDENIDGIILQQPIPKHLNMSVISTIISVNKDVDCMNPTTSGYLFQNRPIFIPPTPNAVMKILDHYNIELEGKDCVIVGRSNVVGKPLAMLLLAKNATIQICHTKTKDLKKHCLNADVLIAAVGRPNTITGDMVKPGAIVIDVGINYVDNRMIGDVCYQDILPIASKITPVPGGIGSLTTTLLMQNTISAFQNKLKIEK